MKKIHFKIDAVLLLFFGTFSCKKKKYDPYIQNVQYTLMSVDGPKGNIRNYEWIGSKLTRVYSKDSISTSIVLKYNINFVYGYKNVIVGSKVVLNGIQFMTNDFSYNEDQTLTSIKTTVNLFGRKSDGKTRLVYNNCNVAKVFSAIDGEIETLAFSGETYDNKLQFLPEVYKTDTLGFVNIANNFFSYFSTNNMTQGKVYNGNGRLGQETKIETK